jgi:hypothetical protein
VVTGGDLTAWEGFTGGSWLSKSKTLHSPCWTCLRFLLVFVGVYNRVIQGRIGRVEGVRIGRYWNKGSPVKAYLEIAAVPVSLGSNPVVKAQFGVGQRAGQSDFRAIHRKVAGYIAARCVTCAGIVLSG